MKPTTKKTAAITLGATVLVAGALIGTSERDAKRDTAGYCVDKSTNQRVDDSECRTNNSSGAHFYGWYYARNGAYYPRVGAPASGGSFTAPTSSSYVQGGLSSAGGTVDAGKVTGGQVHTVRTGGFGHLGGKAGS